MALAHPELHRISAFPLRIWAAKAASPITRSGQVLLLASAAAVISAVLSMAAIAVAPSSSTYSLSTDLSTMMSVLD